MVPIDISTNQKTVSHSNLFVYEEAAAKAAGAFFVMSNRSQRIALAALIDALFTLAVVGKGGRQIVENTEPLFEVTKVAEVQHLVAQVSDQVAVAA